MLSEPTPTDDPLDADEGGLAPPQPPSVHDALLALAFPSPTGALRLSLRVDAAPGCGGVAWPAGEVLARYLARRGTLAGTRAVELGSGTGLVGLVAGLLGARVCLTDQAPLLDTMRRNIALNGLAARVSARELNWGAPLPPDLARPALVLAADCVYFEPAFPLLVQTLADLVPPGSGPDPEVLFCYKKRRKADKRFFALLKKHFSWTQVDDDPDAGAYTRESIALLRLVRKQAPSC